MKPRGIDESKWGGGVFPYHTINFDEYAKEWDFVYVKVSEGTYPDPLFSKQWAAAKGKTYRGAYHFFHPSVDPKFSVEKTLSFLDGDVGELPLMFDMEATDGRSDTVEKAKSWLAWYEQLTGVRPVIYTSPSFLATIRSYEHLWLGNYLLHLASYPFDNFTETLRTYKIYSTLKETTPITFPIVPKPWTKLTFWQWTSRGNPSDVGGYYMGYGHKLAVDFNFFNGSWDEFVLTFKLKELETPIGANMQGRVKSATNIRLGAGQYTTDMGDLFTGDIVTWSTSQLGSDGLTYNYLTDARRAGTAVRMTNGKTLAEQNCFAWANNIEITTDAVTLKHTVEVFSDGSIKVDGNSVS